jgi:high frequency lysogenization protein
LTAMSANKPAGAPNNFSRWENQNLALAAVAQCGALVHELAFKGEAPEAGLIACINPLLVLNPGSIADIYVRPADLSTGLQSLQTIFSRERVRHNAEFVRYTLGMLLLRNKLNDDNEMQQKLRNRLEYIEALRPLPLTDADTEQQEQDQAAQDRTFEQLAALYQDTISTLPYRIRVQGRIDILKNDQIANRIRALLLAGIRSAVLWHQLGGRLWRLLVYRKRIQETAVDIRRKLLTSV